MARSRQPATLTDVDTLRTAQEQLGSKVQHDMREIRERIDQTPDRYRQQWEALALDLDGARAEIANLATNTTKLRQENVANTGQLRAELAEMRTALTEMRTVQEVFGPLFAKFDERLANGLTRVASQITDSETALGDSYLQGRSQLASLRGDIAAHAKEAADETQANATAIIDKLEALPEQISIIRAEVRGELRDLGGLVATLAQKSTVEEVRRHLDLVVDDLGMLRDWLRRPRWWRWRYWFPDKPPEEPAEEVRDDSAP